MALDKVPHLRGWIQDRPDKRDFKQKAALKHRLTFGWALPDQVDLRTYCSAVEDQKSLGSCTGNAIVGALEYLENKNHLQFIDLSRLFVYWFERFLEGTVNSDSGAQIRDGIKAVNKWGTCAESIWPYNIDTFTTKPNDVAIKDAIKHRISKYSRINMGDHTNLKGSLAQGYPVVLGMDVFQCMMDVDSSGVMQMPNPGDQPLGGHALLCVGYRKSDKVYIIRNSWGTDYGDNGYFYIPFDYFNASNGWVTDLWVIQK